MRPWAHESELARYLDGQRSIARGRTPSTPTFPNPNPTIHNEDLLRIEEIATSLHNLKLRLGNSEELADHAERILDYLSQLRRDLPMPAPDRAFTHLQPLRDLIFWLPPAVLHAGESDLAAMTLLSHLNAVALALEPLFPEIGSAYLGTMCLTPTERIHDILRNRRNAQPQDAGCQVALSLVEVPMQIVSRYKSRQRSSNAGLEGYRPSPEASPYLGSHIQMAAPSNSASTLYSTAAIQSPQNIGLPGAAYLSTTSSNASGRRDSPNMRAQMMSERSMSAGSHQMSMSMVYGGHQQAQQPRSSHENSSRMDYFGQSQVPYSYHGGGNAQNRFVTPSQLWV